MEDHVSQMNSKFWDEACGTNTAKELGLTGTDEASLAVFDRWFFTFYPYLKNYLEPVLQADGPVLEVGLGYGSVASHLLSNGVTYQGIDVAMGPVDIANLRATRLGGSGACATIGDVLDMKQFPDDSFSCVVGIGSLHHTGDFDRALSEVIRVCRPDGMVVGMVYSLFSMRNWFKFPFFMLRQLAANLGPTGARVQADETLRWLSDHDSQGRAAPATEYFSRRAIRHALSKYGDVQLRTENVDVSRRFPRRALLHSPLATILGLDIYFTLHVRR